MDEVERVMARERARWRAGLPSGAFLWGFENWPTDKRELHHVAGWKYSDLTIPIPVSMHRELTRRQMEEHPPCGDPSDPAECARRLALGLADIHECFADFYRWMSEKR
jgi:hypothetical protein